MAEYICVCMKTNTCLSICVCVYIYWSQIGRWFKCLPYFLTWTLRRDTCRAGCSLECLGLCPFHLTQMPCGCPCSRAPLRHPWSCSMESRNHLYFSKLLCHRRKLSFLTLKVEIPPWTMKLISQLLLCCSFRWSTGLLLIGSFSSPGFRWFPGRE